MSILRLAIALALLPALADAGVIKKQLGQMMLGSTSVTITQDYLDYYDKGPTGPNTSGGYHPGIDYRAARSTPLYAPLDGVVVSAGGSYGTLVIKKDGSDTNIIVMHMSEFAVKAGDKVQTGCRIGKSGNVGTTDPHLHVEARVGKTTGAWYFTTKTDTGSNKSPELIPPSYVMKPAFACK